MIELTGSERDAINLVIDQALSDPGYCEDNALDILSALDDGRRQLRLLYIWETRSEVEDPFDTNAAYFRPMFDFYAPTCGSWSPYVYHVVAIADGFVLDPQLMDKGIESGISDVDGYIDALREYNASKELSLGTSSYTPILDVYTCDFDPSMCE